MTKFCPNCGYEQHNDDNKFCSNCGYEFPDFIVNEQSDSIDNENKESDPIINNNDEFNTITNGNDESSTITDGNDEFSTLSNDGESTTIKNDDGIKIILKNETSENKNQKSNTSKTRNNGSTSTNSRTRNKTNAPRSNDFLSNLTFNRCFAAFAILIILLLIIGMISEATRTEPYSDKGLTSFLEESHPGTYVDGYGYIDSVEDFLEYSDSQKDDSDYDYLSYDD